MKLYVITAGAYEDYHIIATCTDKAKADQICDEYNKSYNDISYGKAHVEEYPDRSNLNLNQHVYYVNYGNPPYAHEAHGTDKIDILCEVWNVISICNGKPSYIYVTANSKEEAIQKAESILEAQSCK